MIFFIIKEIRKTAITERTTIVYAEGRAVENFQNGQTKMMEVKMQTAKRRIILKTDKNLLEKELFEVVFCLFIIVTNLE